MQQDCPSIAIEPDQSPTRSGGGESRAKPAITETRRAATSRRAATGHDVECG